MCNVNQLAFGQGTTKFGMAVDPANLSGAFGKPVNIPAPTAPQDIKQPDVPRQTGQKYRKPQATMLTGPTGITSGSLNTGGTTLLGG